MQEWHTKDDEKMKKSDILRKVTSALPLGSAYGKSSPRRYWHEKMKILNITKPIDGMNNSGHLLIIILIAIFAVIFLLPILMYVSPIINIIIRIILVFLIITTVRGYLGSGVITLLISGVLIYYLVIKWWVVGATVSFAIMLMAFGVFGVIVWGLGTTLRPKG